MKAWKRLASGRYVDLNNLELSDIDIGDIEVSLNYTYRFNGHHKDKKPLTVAQHTLLCMQLSDELFGDERVRQGCLIHDFGEAYYGDIATPVKRLLGEDVHNFFSSIDRLINMKFWKWGVAPTQDIEECVKVCDLLALDIERRTMWESQVGKDKWPLVPDNKFKLFDKQAMFDEVANIHYVDLERFLT